MSRENINEHLSSHEYVFPASFSQQRLWLIDKILENKSVYNISSCIDVTGNLDIEILTKSLNRIVERHEILRTYFEMDDGELLQIVKPSQEIEIEYVDLQHLTKESIERECSLLAEKEANHQFNLNDPNSNLIKVLLVQVAPEKFKLFITLHHIIADGWSLGLLMEEMSVIYNSLYSGTTDNLSDLSIQYGDYSVWERDLLKSDQMKSKLEFWSDYLGGELPILELPTDMPRPLQQSYKGALFKFEIPLELSESLKKISFKEGSTIYMTLLSAFKILLYRLSGQKDIIVGSPIANRNTEEVEQLIGCFVNNLVLRTDLSGNPTFRELLNLTKKNTTSALSNQEVPFEKILQKVNFKRNNSYSPIFQVMFVFQNTPKQKLNLHNLTIETSRNYNGTCKYDLTLEVTESKNGMECVFEYNNELFKSSTIERWTRHFITLLENIVDNPDKKVSYLSILTHEEKKELLVTWNRTKKEFSKEKCIHHLFEEQVKLNPNKIAVTYENQSITYQELNFSANQLANYLLKNGLHKESLVGICLERSLDMIIALLGVLKAGGAYVPLEPEHPPDRLNFVVKDAKVSIVLTQEKYLEKFMLPKNKIILMDKNKDSISNESEKDLEINCNSGNLVYTIYTSGSTGTPKGVCVEHKQLLNYVYDRIIKLNLNETPRLSYATVSTLAADLGNTPIFLSLCTGGHLHVISQERILDTSKLAEYFKLHSIDCLKVVPSHLSLLLSNEDGKYILPKRFLIVGGESLHFDLIERIYNYEHSCVIINEYGPTEATIGTIDFVLKNINQKFSTDTVPIGKPISNTQIYILDEYYQPVPIGVPGEIFIGGESVARGYFNNPELTADKFLEIPEISKGNRLYRTGDIARYLPDGNIEYIGRKDDQVKIRGFRVELGEIESIIRQHNNVRELAVIIHKTPNGNQSLVAYVSLFNKDANFQYDVRKYLKKRLPDYMIPAHFIEMENIPLTPNGKVNRSALPSPSTLHQPADKIYVKPKTVLERGMVKIWEELLETDKIGITDNFFEVGGHSLLAAKLVSKMRKNLGIDVSIQTVFSHPTIEKLINYNSHKLTGKDFRQMIIHERPDKASYPMSYAQKGIWIQEQLHKDTNVYNMSLPIKVIGKLDIRILEKSINKIIQRHETLRAVFINQYGLPIQKLKEPEFNLEVELIDDVNDEFVYQKIQLEGQKPFDLEKGPIFRIKLLRKSKEEHILIFTLHHIIGDAISFKNLLNETFTIYNSMVNKNPCNLPELKIQYSDFAHWQSQYINTDEFQNRLLYWKNKLKGAPQYIKLPIEKPRPEVQSFNGKSINFQISREKSQMLRELAQKEGVTPYMLFMTAWNLLLYSYTGQKDIIVGTSASGRTDNTEDLVGLFVNTLPIRTKLDGEWSFLELLKDSKRTILEAFSHQDVPFEIIINTIKTHRDPSRPPLCQIFLTYHYSKSKVEISNNLTLEVMPINLTSIQYDIVAEIFDDSEIISGRIEFCTDLFREEDINQLIFNYLDVFDKILEDPTVKISCFRNSLKQFVN
ncbi:amino acid adenylation domain-containing protein [Anoxybacillus sp. PDR2]|jgi:amino acid adenylation domain-containing protein|uniref:non-ribosomal peptide synthetase n=1 Tax=Anoxybacillaceae TaxID=3120669 RepID=UPI00131900AB|nr:MULTISPECIES: non-ribosomal peptide synthetase [Anoxybacillus]MBS2772897.1 amino acid adenylation domain-containing protein [Anoxybacillus rupiensis]QHC02995.1 amino acid adenylation domain-containing protein [Anoxybacillus sp. PDR2]